LLAKLRVKMAVTKGCCALVGFFRITHYKFIFFTIELFCFVKIVLFQRPAK
jgi:hypothetical protein